MLCFQELLEELKEREEDLSSIVKSADAFKENIQVTKSKMMNSENKLKAHLSIKNMEMDSQFKSRSNIYFYIYFLMLWNWCRKWKICH